VNRKRTGSNASGATNAWQMQAVWSLVNQINKMQVPSFKMESSIPVLTQDSLFTCISELESQRVSYTVPPELADIQD